MQKKIPTRLPLSSQTTRKWDEEHKQNKQYLFF